MIALEKSNQGIQIADRGLFLQAMSMLPSAVSLVTTGEGTKRMGLTVSAVCSLSADPPSLIVCINKNAGAHDEILKTEIFAVNVLQHDQVHYANLFSQKNVDRFASKDWIQSPAGAPILTGALIALECKLEQAFDGFSHTIMVGRVSDIMLADEPTPECLVWHRRRYRTCSEII